MDLNDLIAAADAVMEIVDARGEPMKNDRSEPMTITFHGVDSEPYIAARNASINRVKTATSRGRPMTAEEDVAMTIDFLAAVTKGWSGLQESGAPIEFSRANAKKIYERIPALRAQADTFTARLGLRVDFSSAAPKT